MKTVFPILIQWMALEHAFSQRVERPLGRYDEGITSVLDHPPGENTIPHREQDDVAREQSRRPRSGPE
jgi:hypothetical protein